MANPIIKKSNAIMISLSIKITPYFVHLPTAVALKKSTNVNSASMSDLARLPFCKPIAGVAINVINK